MSQYELRNVNGARVVKYKLELATEHDLERLQKFDYTKLSAVNMCPTWGITRYSLHKAMPGGGRSMALEAGSAMHECFAAIRLVQLGHPEGQDLYNLMCYHGSRMFGADRWAMMLGGWNSGDITSATKSVALECLASAGYVDDPFDKRRTYINLETALLYYIQRWDHKRYPIWVRDITDTISDVGIEIPFAVKITCMGDQSLVKYGVVVEKEFIYTGRIDGLHLTGPDSNECMIQENKTAARLDDAWRMSFDMSHQVTGYAVAASLFSNTYIKRGLVIGLSIPLPKYAHEGMAMESVKREDFMKARWLDWMHYTVSVHDKYKDDVLNAPQHTHSCNRYFRPCSLIPFCASDDTERADILNQMVEEEWSPLAEKAGD
jgi:hypothetical protein